LKITGNFYEEKQHQLHSFAVKVRFYLWSVFIHIVFSVIKRSSIVFSKVCILGVKRPGREADHSPPSSAEGQRMRGAIPPFSQYVIMAWCLVKHRVNFTFTFRGHSTAEALKRENNRCNNANQ